MEHPDLPEISDRCSSFFTYRDFIECSDTWRKSKVVNTPRQPATFAAIGQLATQILDPIVERLGDVRLTYGFSSANLIREMKGKRLQVAPSVDQHASCELNSNGEPFCPHLGASCDFYVGHYEQRMDQVASWIISNLPFDRLFYYGRNRPLHVSFGPSHKRQVTFLKPRRTGGYSANGTYTDNQPKALEKLEGIEY